MIRNSKLLISLLASTILISCSRKTDDVAKFSIQLPSNIASLAGKNSKLYTFSNATVTHIAINIRGPGIDPVIVYSWDKHDACPSGNCTGLTITAPTEISLDVSKGDNRLIQVLLVVEDSSSHAMDFLYSDQTVNLNESSVNVAIAPTSIGSSTGAEGKIIGRYINSAGTGPTGPITGYFNPPNGKASMQVVDGFMWGGWFEAFVLDGASFSYRSNKSNENIFENITLKQFDTLTTASVARLHIPNYCRWDGNSTHSYNCDNGKGTAGEDLIYGFFGPGASGKTAYYNNGVSSISQAYSTCTQSANVYSCTGNITYSNTSATNSVYPVSSGGTAVSSTSACSGTSVGVSCLMADASALATKGRDGTIGVKGPFLVSNYGVINATQSAVGSPVTLTWQLLDGTFGSVNDIDGVDVFYANSIISRNLLRSNSSIGDLYSCNNLSSFGFNLFSGNVSGLLGATQTAILSSTEIANINLSAITVVLCPYSKDFWGNGRTYLPTTAGYFNDYSGGYTGTTPTTTTTLPASNPSLAIKNMSYVNTATLIGASSCAGPFTIERKDGAGNNDYSATPLNFSLAFSNPGSGVNVYLTSDECLRNINLLNSNNLTIQGGQASQIFYIKSNNSSTTHLATASAASYTSGTLSLNVDSSSAGFVQFGLDMVGPYNQFSNTFNYTFVGGELTGLAPSTVSIPMSNSSSIYIMVRFTNFVSGTNTAITNLYASNGSGPYFMFSTGFPGGAGTCTSGGQSLSYGTSCTARLVMISPPSGSGVFTSPISVSWTDYYGSNLTYQVQMSGSTP